MKDCYFNFASVVFFENFVIRMLSQPHPIRVGAPCPGICRRFPLHHVNFPYYIGKILRVLQEICRNGIYIIFEGYAQRNVTTEIKFNQNN